MKNVIYLRFFDKTGFPQGKWMREPDLCQWYHSGFSCLALRDMTLGVWRSFVGVESNHPLHSKNLDDILEIHPMMDAYIYVYGGISVIGQLPDKYKAESSGLWWFSIETSGGNDFMPLLQCQTSELDSSLLYKDFSFIRRETNKLAEYISQVNIAGNL